MRIRLKLFAGLRALDPRGGQSGGGDIEIPQGATVAQALERLEVPPEEDKIILVNGLHAKPETVLKEGDRLSVFPPVGGG